MLNPMKIVSLLFLAVVTLISEQAFAQAAGNLSYADVHTETSYSSKELRYQVKPKTVQLNVSDPAYIAPVYSNASKSDTKTEVVEEVRVAVKSYRAYFPLEVSGSSATQAERTMKNLVSNFTNQLNRSGVRANNSNATFEALVPVYTKLINNEFVGEEAKQLEGFTLRKKYVVTFSDYDQLERIISTAHQAGIKTLDRVEHIIEYK